MRDNTTRLDTTTPLTGDPSNRRANSVTTKLLLVGLAGVLLSAINLAIAQDDPPFPQVELQVELQAQGNVQAQQLQPARPVQPQAQAVDDLVIGEEDGADDDFLDELDLNPGFMFTPIQDASEDDGINADLIKEMLNAFYKNLDSGQWEKAFKDLLTLSKATRHAMVLVGEEGSYVPVRRSIQMKLRELPADGRRAFSAFFDAYARELLEKCLDHPAPGSEAQLALAEEIYEMYLMSSSGGAAANLLGDMLFEQGRFGEAADCWAAIPRYRIDAPISELALQVKLAIALGRAGQSSHAHALTESIRLRNAGQTVTLGGREHIATELLDAVLPQAAQVENTSLANPIPTGLPTAESPPTWRMTFVDDTAQRRLAQPDANRGFYYGASTDLLQFVPPAVYDDQAVYLNWMGVVFAIDIETGKLLWRTGSFTTAARGVSGRMNGIAGNPRAYQIAQAGNLVFTVDTPQGRTNPELFVLSAFDKGTGQAAWNSQTMPAWVDHSFCGQIITDGDLLYAISHPKDTRDFSLHCITAATGEIQWSLPLGEADVKAIQWQQFVTMPQPAMKLVDDTLFVLTNNAALIAVDTARGELAWGQRLGVPEGLTNVNNFGQQASVSTNSQGTGGLYVAGNTLYVKEAQSRQLYGIDLTTHQVVWNKATHQHSEIVGADGDHVFLMDQRLRAYRTAERHQLHWNNNQLRNPSFANGILTDNHIFMLTDRRLQMLDLESGDASDTFDSRYLRGNGGRLLLAGDLMICVTKRDITAFRVPTSDPNTSE